MLNADLAGRFVEQISTCTDYNVNIMNESGIIIASRDTGRIDSYHETAHEMIKRGQDMIAVTDSESYFGVKSGVNLLVYDGKKPVGVVGVTGDPKKVQEIALIIKMALESMIRYEQQRETFYNTRTARERFYISIFEEENPGQGKLEELANSLHISLRRVRVPILLAFSEQSGQKTVFDSMSNMISQQDILWSKDNLHVLLYKDLGAEEGKTLSTWRGDTAEYLRKLALSCDYTHAYVGTLQCRLYYYKQGLAHCLWLEKNIPSKERDIYFMDYISQYIQAFLPTGELHNIWNAYDCCLDKGSKSEIRRIVEPLLQSNYNMVTASKELFIHKNTLAFRMNKLRSILDIDPFRSGTDRLFLNCLYYYLKRKS